MGTRTQPGLAMLRWRRVRSTRRRWRSAGWRTKQPSRVARSQVLAVFVEIMLAAHDIRAAAAAADELAQIADDLDALLVHAVAGHATGAVLLGEGDAGAALVVLRRAWAAWRELDAPYEAARVRVLIGLACRELGDGDTAAVELDAARSVFRQLARRSTLRGSTRSSPPVGVRAPMGLTRRELEVLALVATGKTNREIAAALVISEHTVARHVQNIFGEAGRLIPHGGQRVCIEHGLV